MQSLFAEVNNLPADDPLRDPANQGAAPETAEVSADASQPPLPGPAAPASNRSARSSAGRIQASAKPQTSAAPAKPASVPAPPSQNRQTVAIPNQRVAVPSFAGKSLREVVIQASNAGLGVQIVGSGLARDQVPAAGTLVPAGTDIVVRFGPQ